MSQVNLLPPELRARQKTKQQTILILGAGVAMLVLLLGYWFLESQKLSDVNEQVAAQELTNTQIQGQIDQLQQFQQLQVEAGAQQALLDSAFSGEVSFSQMLMDVSRTIPSDAYLNAFNAALTPQVVGEVAATPTTSFVGSFTASGGADGFESLASWLTRLESVKGWVNPWLSSATETGPNTGLYSFTSGVDLTEDVLTARGQEGEPSGGRRAPIFAGAGVVAVVIIVTFFLVLPKAGQVKDANATLTEAQAQQATLGAQLAALQQAETEAPINRETIRRVQQAIPPTVDQQGFILLLQNAAVQSSVDVVTITPSTPIFDPATGLSTVTNTVNCTGSYFAITEFLFQIETLPRAAKTTSVGIAPSPSETNASLLTVTLAIDMYTSDQSAGPGSSPGPTSTGGATTPTATAPPTGASPSAVTSQGG